MSIVFHCPGCGAIIAFADQHAGKRAQCATCGQRLIIPDSSHAAPQKIVESKAAQPCEAPLPGFYRAALLTSWAALFRPGSVTGLVFVTALVCLKFFTAHVDYSFTMGGFRFQMPFGWITRCLAWGGLFWYYLEVINSAALKEPDLPGIDIDGGFDFLGKAIKSISVFCLSLLLCLVPTILAIKITGEPSSFLVTLLTYIGLFWLPMMLLALGLTQDMFILWRVDTMFLPVVKAFFPYLTCALLIMLVWTLQIRTANYGDPSLQNAALSIKLMSLAAQVGIQLLTLIAMRALGLFYRHYTGYFTW